MGFNDLLSDFGMVLLYIREINKMEMKRISHTYRVLPLVIIALFSFSSKAMTGDTEGMKITHFAKKKRIYKTRRLALAKADPMAAMSGFEAKAELIYKAIDTTVFTMPEFKVFTKALKGFYALKAGGIVQKNILTIIDFSLSSTAKRLWVIDLDNGKVLFQSLVAHGKNSGEEFASSFSNKGESYKSSLGFYATGETYNGKHGKSLRLDGLEKGLNDKARERGVVVHAAEYVSQSFINSNKRLGRSQGCPALPEELASEIIEIIKDKSCLFIYHPSIGEIDEIS